MIDPDDDGNSWEYWAFIGDGVGTECYYIHIQGWD